MPKSEVFIACSNVKDDYLTQLGKEMNGVILALYGFREKGALGLDYPPIDADAQTLFNWLSNYNEANKPLDLFHYSGHASAHHFMTIGGEYGEDKLVDLFSGLKPKLVFLNGCSTNGFVGRLLASGVGAVIATSVEVKDSVAARFAINFYEAFSKKQTLRDAFRKARTVLSGNSDTNAGIVIQMEENKNSQEVYREWGNLPPRDRTAAWGLYHTDEKADYNGTGVLCSILDWKLVTVDGADLALPPRVNTLNKEIDEIWNSAKRQDIDEAIKDAQELLDLLEKPDGRDKAQKILDAARKREQDEIIRPVQEKQDELFKILREPALKYRRKLIAEDIKKLKYKDQEDFLGEINLGKQVLGALLLQGGPRCALKLLQERMVHEVQLPVDTENCRLELINLSSNIYSTDELFRQISQRFPAARTSNDIIDEIEALFVNGIDYVLVFNNFAKTIAKAQLGVLKQFWIDIVKRHLQPTRPVTPSGKGRVLLFILDKNCRLVDENGKQTSSNEKEYCDNFADKDNYAYVVPIVKCVNNEIVKPWIEQSFVAYKKDKFSFSKFEKPHFMLDVIEKVCDELETEVFGEPLDLYINEFAKYAYSPPVIEKALNAAPQTNQEIDALKL